MVRLVGSVREEKLDGSRGYGCISIADLNPGQSLGFESPLATAPALYSRKFLPCCEHCLHHAWGFSDTISFLIHDTESELAHSFVKFSCKDCGVRICRVCSKEGINLHRRMCHHGEPRLREARLRLERICLATTESPIIALVFLASLLERGCTIGVELFNDPKFSYFLRHERADRPETHEACEVVSLLLSTPLDNLFFKRVVDTFDQTNLYLEIENETMMGDIAAGKITHAMEESLKAAYARRLYPAILHDDDMYPIPVVIGSGHYPTVARMNHSCDPNVEWRSVSGSATIEMIALRPIAAGEEVVLSYIDQTLPVNERRSKLLELYGFECLCQKCLSDLNQ